MLSIQNLSGEDVALLASDQIESLMQTNESLVGVTERFLAAKMGQPRFRLKLVSQGQILNHDAELQLPLTVQVAVCDFCPADASKIKELIDASAMNDTKVVEALLREPQDPNQRDGQGRTPLFIASNEGHAKVVRLLMDAGADKDKATDNGWTPLCIASYKGHLEVVRLLVDAGADKDKATDVGWTPMRIASRKGHLEVVRLLDGGAGKDKATCGPTTAA